MINIGCCGFVRKLQDYMKEFNCVEVQQTFYKIPKPQTLKNWANLANQTTNKFEFYIKANQMITHPASSPTYKKLNIKIENKENYGYFKPTKEVQKAFELTKEAAKILSCRIIIFQMPASFKPIKENLDNLRTFFEKEKRNHIKYGLELRGKSWKIDLIKSICKDYDLIDVVDPFERNPCIVPKDKILYFRLHGSPPGNKMYNYKYTDKDLEYLANLIKNYLSCNIYILFNNIYMYEDAKRLKELLLV